MRLKSDLKDVLDYTSEEHAVGIATHEDKANGINSFSKATNVTGHVENRVNHSFILDNAVVKAELCLKVCSGVERAQRRAL